MSRLTNEARQATRSLLRNTAFSFAFLITLTLGVGGLTAFYALVHGVLIETLPYPEPDRLLYFRWKSTGGMSRLSSADKFLHWAQRSRAFSSLAAYEAQTAGATLVTQREPDYVSSLGVTPSLFATLGITPVRGRSFTPHEAGDDGTCVAVARTSLWRRAWGETSLEDRTFRLGERPCTLVGVLPANLRFPVEADVWTPLHLKPGASGGANLYAMVGRLAPEVTAEEANEEAAALFAELRREQPGSVPEDELEVVLTPFAEHLVGDIRQELLLLFAAGVLVFLICCLNLSNLVATRALQRSRESAVLVAVGAGWYRLLRHAMMEVALLAIAGTFAGWALAWFMVPRLVALEPGMLPVVARVEVGIAEVLFAGAASVVAALLIAIIPVSQVSRGDIHGRLKPAAAGAGERFTPASRLFGRLLVAAQVAISVVVLVAAAVVVDSLLQLRAVSPGFDSSGVWSFQIPLPPNKFADPGALPRFERALLSRLDEAPAISVAALSSSLPLEPGLNVPVSVEGRPDSGTTVEYRAVSSDYFAALHIPVLVGRSFIRSDLADGPPVAVINEALARHYWGGRRQPLGEILWAARELGELSDRPRQVVGVVADVRDVTLKQPPQPILYVPRVQLPPGLDAVIRQAFPAAVLVRLTPSESLPNLRELVAEIDSHLAVAHLRPLDELLHDAVRRERFYASLLTLFGVFALALTTVGIYGIVRLFVNQRRRDLCLRMALGAQGRDIQALVLGQALVVVGLGLLLGLPLAFGFRGFLGSLAYGTATVGVASLTLVALGLSGVALLAALMAAGDVARREPAHALQ